MDLMSVDSSLVLYQSIERQIFLIRGQKVMLDRVLAALYGVPTKSLKQSVRRNLERFPEDFMFVLSREEFAHWRSQFVTSNADRMGLRHAPMAFTEFGVAMLSSVLNSSRAIQVNIRIMRAFWQMRQTIETHKALAQKLAQLEAKVGDHDEDLKTLFEAMRQLMVQPEKKKKSPIGFGVKEKKARYNAQRAKRAKK
jgi:hypothetical protein